MNGQTTKCLSNFKSQDYLRNKLLETVFATRRQSRVGKFFKKANGKTGKQSIPQQVEIHGWDYRRLLWSGTHGPRNLETPEEILL